MHRVVAAAMIGRDLKKDEEVHHRDEDRRNFHFSNLMILGEYDHGFVSARQAYFMKHIREVADKREWDTFMDDAASKQKEEITAARMNGESWEYTDGHLEAKWEQRPTT